ncbi:hypothetical protein [Actinomadura sp. WMMA1423]|uniref:hypothetical protein n=1 Tax=Actinomadura sp. WMMA1423 TaxID=2591108 RepID=UPI001146358E|nr:hypothetical protein [Actinomadura sp. WMMA1423]
MPDQTTTGDHDMRALYTQLAELTGRTVEEAAALTKDDLIDLTARLSFQTLGLQIAHRFEKADGIHLMEEGPQGHAARVTEALERLHGRVPLWPATLQDITADLFGFGRAPVRFVTQNGDEGGHPVRYFLLSELAEPLGITLPKAHAWAEQEQVEALRAQRETDEERGALGWECMNDVIDLGVWLTVDDPEAEPDAGGARWSTAGEWLVSDRRLLALMTWSPWSREFYENARPLMAHAMLHSGLADRLAKVPTYTTVETCDGQTITGPTGDTLGDRIREDAAGMSVEDAARRAMRGLDLGSE